MKRLGFFTILFTLLSACQKDYNKTKQPYKFIPQESSAIIQINELNDFISSIDNNEILSSLYQKELKNASQVLNQLHTTEEIYISFSDSTQTDYLILTENDSTLFVIDAVPNHISETLKDSKINKTQINDYTFYHTVLGNTFCGSNNLELLKNLDPENENEELSKLIETTDRKSVASIIFKSIQNYCLQVLEIKPTQTLRL